MDRTIKKSSPEDFRPLTTTPGDSFRLSPGFWDAMTSDPLVREELRRELEARIESGINERLRLETATVFDEARDRGYRAGFDAGHEAGLKEGAVSGHDRWRLIESKLDEVCKDIVENRGLLLSAHERAWSSALRHLLKRFLVPHASSIGELVSAWLEEALARFSSTARVSIRVSPPDYEQWAAHLPQKAGKTWEIQPDATLPRGEVSCECEDGGIVFSATEELNKLDAWLSQFENQTEPVELVLGSSLEGIA